MRLVPTLTTTLMLIVTSGAIAAGMSGLAIETFMACRNGIALTAGGGFSLFVPFSISAEIAGRVCRGPSGRDSTLQLKWLSGKMKKVATFPCLYQMLPAASPTGLNTTCDIGRDIRP